MKQIKIIKGKMFQNEKKYKKILNSKLNKNKKYIEKELKLIFYNIFAPKVLKKVMFYAVLNGGKELDHL